MTDDTQRKEERERKPAQRPNVDKCESGKYDWDRDELQECDSLQAPRRKGARAGMGSWMGALAARLLQWLRPGGAFGGDDDASPTPA